MNSNEFADILGDLERRKGLHGWSPGGFLWEEGGLGMYSPEGKLYEEHPELYRRDLPRRLEEWYGEEPTARTGTQGLTGGEFADILKSREYLKMSPLEKLQVQRQLEELKNLRAKEIRERGEHATEERTKRAEQERIEEIQGILRSRRTPAQKVTALTVIGIPLSQAREMIWGELPKERAVEREPAGRRPTQEELLGALKPEEERMRLVGGEWIPYPTEEKLTAIEARGEEYRTRKLAAEKERKERERQIHTQRRRRAYIEMGASGDWTKNEVIAQLIGEGMSASEAAAATAHLPSRAEIEAKREEKITAIGVIGREAQKEKRDREEAKSKAEDLKIKQRGMQKRIMNYFDLYKTKDWNKSELVSALAADGWKPQDVASLTGQLPDDWEKEKDIKAELERAETKTVQHAKDVQTYWDDKRKAERDYSDALKEKAEEKATAERNYKDERIDRKFEYVKMLREMGIDDDDLVDASAKMLQMAGESKETVENVADMLGITVAVKQKQDKENLEVYSTALKTQIQETEKRITKEGFTDELKAQVEAIALTELTKDIAQLSLAKAIQKWDKPDQWWFVPGEVPFTNSEAQTLFRETIRKYAHEATGLSVTDIAEKVVVDKMVKQGEVIRGEARKAAAKQKEEIPIEIPGGLRGALTGMSNNERDLALDCYGSIFNRKTGDIWEPGSGSRLDQLLILTCGVRPEDKTKDDKTNEYKKSLLVNMDDAQYTTTIIKKPGLTTKERGWLLWTRFNPILWSGIMQTASARENYMLPEQDIEESEGFLGRFGRFIGEQAKLLTQPGEWWPFGRGEETPTAGPGEQIVLPNIDNIAAEILKDPNLKTQAQLRKRLQNKNFSDIEIDSYFGRMR